MALTRWIALGLALAFTAGFSTASPAGDWSTIRFGTEGAYAPFNYHDAAGKLQGFDVDIAQALCDKMGAKCELVAVQFDGIILALQNSQIDAIITSMAITEKRKKVVDFTDKYWTRYYQFISCGSVPGEDSSPAALKGRKIGTQQGTVGDGFLEDEYKGSDVRLYKTMDDAYLDIGAGRLDAVLSGEAVAYAFMKTDAGKSCRFIGGRVVSDKLLPAKAGIAIRKTDTDLRDKLNAALKQILADGTYEKINAKYFPFSIY